MEESEQTAPAPEPAAKLPWETPSLSQLSVVRDTQAQTPNPGADGPSNYASS